MRELIIVLKKCLITKTNRNRFEIIELFENLNLLDSKTNSNRTMIQFDLIRFEFERFAHLYHWSIQASDKTFSTFYHIKNIIIYIYLILNVWHKTNLIY